jgi:hypothetical protein
VTRSVWIDGTKVALVPRALLGQGGEAEVYDLGDGRVVKWWKPADHPDFDGMPIAQQAAAARIAQAPAKLRALPGNLPAAVVAPCGFALDRKKQVCGYLMPKIGGTALHDYGEPRWRRDHPVPGGDVVAALLALHDAITGLHRAGVVVGDCNDLNVLVDASRVHLIDVDSYQYAGFTCSMFSERFVDPRLCDPQQLVPIRPHDEDSDWFAYAVMVLRSLVCVGPWGGVAKSCLPGARALRRHSVFAADVTYPRAARPLVILPDELVDTLSKIFEDDQRGVFPRSVLERLRFRACSACGEEHARVRCPACQALAHVPPAIVHGNLRFHHIAVEEVMVGTWCVGLEARGHEDLVVGTSRVRPEARGVEDDMQRTAGTVWLHGDALMRSTRLGPERIGSVLAGQTHAWVGAKLGVGFYRAGGYAAGFVFRPDRGVLDDRVTLPMIRGQLVSSHAVIAEDRAWLLLTCANAGQLATTCIVIAADTSVLATDTLTDASWLAGIGGACAAGPHLFVPTDDGIARIEIVQRAIVETRRFAETAPLITASDVLALSATGIDVLRRRDAIRMQLT